MKQLLVDYIPFNRSMNYVIVKGVLQRNEAKNQNGRVYPDGTSSA